LLCWQAVPATAHHRPAHRPPLPLPHPPALRRPAKKKKVDYPKQPIELIVPANPGGDTDINARQFAEYFSQEIGQTVVVVNVAGAGGSTATRQVKDAAGDGYQLLFFHPNVLIGMITVLWITTSLRSSSCWLCPPVIPRRLS
jgi:tripartite-type tricarboxylate transporter receptor subunit TctC